MPDEAGHAAALAHRPGLVVITGPPGSGRTTTLRRTAATLPGPVHAGGGLAMLQTVPALALSRAVRARLPAHDVHLLAEAVRSRVRGGLLVLDDLQYADPATLAALPHLARHCRVLAALRTPHRLPPATVDALQAAATGWTAVPPLSPQAAHDLARHSAAQLDDATLAAVVARAGGNPLAVITLARHAAAGQGGLGEVDQIAYAVATALADLTRPARTALAALGLLGRPAPATLLGPGAADLLSAGLVTAEPDGRLLPVSTYLAETAAGLLDAAARTDLHGRLADLTPPAEAARHLAAAGRPADAHRRALQAADQAVGGERAGLLLFACDLDVPVDPRVRLAAADALLAAGRPADAARILLPASSRAVASRTAPPAPRTPTPPTPPPPTSVNPSSLDPSGGDLSSLGASAADVAASLDASAVSSAASLDASAVSSAASVDAPAVGLAASLAAEADVLRGEALLQAGDPAGARRAVQSVPDAAPAPVAAGRDRVLLLAELATDPDAAQDLAAKVTARHPQPSAGVAAALAAVQAWHRTPGWDTALAAVARPGTDPLIARWSAWLLVEHLVADGRLPDAARVALRAAGDCARDLSYGWQTRFAAAADWALALHGTGLPPASDPVVAADAGSRSRPATEHPVSPAASSPDRGGARVGSGVRGAGREGAAQAAADLSWDGPEGVLRRAANLTDRALPDEARGYAIAATALIEADTGLLAAAHDHLDAAPAHPATAWVARETAWLDGQPERALHPVGAARPSPAAQPLFAPRSDRAAQAFVADHSDRAAQPLAADYSDRAAQPFVAAQSDRAAQAFVADHSDRAAQPFVAAQSDRVAQQPPGGLLAGLHAITARWAAHDLGTPGTPPIPPRLPTAARRTLTAWAVGTGFTAAAEGWQPVALREQIRCLLAAGVTDPDRDRAVAALLTAEQLADAAGLTVLAGRARRGLRRHQIHRDVRSPRSGDQLTRREHDVLRLVAAGEPTRRIAGQLGISAETVDTHIRAGMRKLGARTRTEAAALAFARPPDPPKDGR